MRVIAFRTLREFFEKTEYSDAEVFLRAWYYDVKSANWKNSNELKNQYPKASIVREGRAVFNIKRNKYRLVVAIDYEIQAIFIRFIGTHKQYDSIDVKTI
ncbi:type II toxin-antitoxin system HigB family toxin [Salinimicrobium sp. CDJ15-81-2]|nr:type II toxin-antitoxin system HigB family toxin [Salinimicrobium nanhaiense]